MVETPVDRVEIAQVWGTDRLPCLYLRHSPPRSVSGDSWCFWCHWPDL